MMHVTQHDKDDAHDAIKYDMMLSHKCEVKSSICFYPGVFLALLIAILWLLSGPNTVHSVYWILKMGLWGLTL